MKKIPLTRGLVAIVDERDYNVLRGHSWHALKTRGKFYACTRIYPFRGSKTSEFVYMHRMITSAQRGFVVDHKNGDGLDNRRENLRVCTQTENGANRAVKSIGKSSVFKGVHFARREKRWMAKIQYKRKQIVIGYYRNEVDAARAYDAKAIELFGEFARPNFYEPNKNLLYDLHKEAKERDMRNP
jgi:hypothetical protein